MENPTTKRPLLKGCLVVVGGLLLAAGLLAGWWWWAARQRQAQAVLDERKYSVECDTIRFIIERPAISFSGFRPAELQKLTFYLIRSGQLVQDTTVRYPGRDELAAFNMPIAFTRFLKTDTVVVKTAGDAPRFYRLSGFHHYAYLHYGMFGYLGSHDCRFADGDYLVNSQRNQDFLRRQDGLLALALPTRRPAAR